MKTLTGKTKYRIEPKLFGGQLIVLQVEEQETNRSHMYNEAGRVEIDHLPDVSYYRDATFSDLQELKLL